ncbi:MAG: 2'-5' RNA ligase [Omnitrophica WOR_2 bacterium RBG_13_44_8b]|nr:MAG: 2'-5' RNA ligase [Omnitrophica WOR_2 bacterium RBG_13_44_8b]
MRTFIAIELPEEIRDALAKLEQQLKSAQADVKWVAPENIHLTLKFLGEIDDKKSESIINITNDIASHENPFQARISSIGAFPKMSALRVIWVGIDKGDEETRKIALELENLIAKLGIPKEDRPFSSHITIGRTRSAINRERLVQELNKFGGQLTQENLEFSVTKITLFKSTLTPHGPIYEILNEAHLKTT